MPKVTRNSISIKKKLEIILKKESGMKSKDICNLYGIHKSVLTRIVQNKENLEEFACKSLKLSSSRKQIHQRKFENVEDSLYKWFLIEREKKSIVTNYILQIKAMEFYNESGMTAAFSASTGWLERFKRRYGIRLLKICGEELSADANSIGPFLTKFKEKCIEMDLRPDQIYNCDETAFVYKNLNDRTLVLSSEKKAPGRKNSKERVTIMPCVNATGKHKLPLVMIGKSKNPRCLKDVTLPLRYSSSKNAWQTSELFKNWFFDQFVPEVTTFLEDQNLPIRALLLLDNASCHCNETILKTPEGNIQVMFLPPNTTALIQPLDQHIIKAMKTNYRRELLISMIGKNVAEEIKKLNLRSVGFMIASVWETLSETVIVSGFKHLFESDTINFNLPMNHFDESDDVPLAALYREVLPNSEMTEEEIEDWGEGNNETITAQADNMVIDDVEVEEEHESTSRSTEKLNNLLQCYSSIIEDATDSAYPVNEIIFLRKLRDKLLIEKFGIN